MKVPCTECNRFCKRKVVNRGTKDLNRIYYKCEECNHKVGWEDELLTGAQPWRKKPGSRAKDPKILPTQESHQVRRPSQHEPAPTAPESAQPPAALPPAALPPEAQPQAAQPQALQAAAQAAGARPKTAPTQAQAAAAPPARQSQPGPPPAKTKEAADESEVEILFERPARRPSTRTRAPAPAPTAAPKPTAPHALSPDSCEEVSEAGHPQPAPSGRPSRPDAPKLPKVEPQQPQQEPLRQSPSVPPSIPGASQGPQCLAPSPSGPRPSTEDALNAAAASKRKFDEAFTDAAGRAPKRPAHDGPAPGSAPGSSPAGVFGTRAVPIVLPQGRAGVAQPGPNATASTPTVTTGVTGVAGAMKGDGVFMARVVPRGSSAGVAASAAAAAAHAGPAGADRQGSLHAAAAGGTFVPPVAAAGRPGSATAPLGSRGVAGATAPLGGEAGADTSSKPNGRPGIRLVGPDNEEVLRQEVRRLRRDLAVASAQLREEQARRQEDAASMAGLLARNQILEQDLQVLRAKHQSSLLRERQLTERMNLYVARERAQQAQQQAAAQQAFQQAAQQAHQQAAQQAQEQYYTWYQQQQQQAQQAGTYPGGPRAGAGGSPSRTGGPTVNGAAAGGPPAQPRAGGHRVRAHGSGGGGAAGPNGTVPPGHEQKQNPHAHQQQQQHHHQQQQPPQQQAPPQDDLNTLLALANATPPTLDDGASVRVLKQFLAESGTSDVLVRQCAEKAELLTLARERLNAWEVRRVIACSKLGARGGGDLALFRLTSGAMMQKSVITKAWRDLMLRLHPDKNPNDDLATPAFQYMNEAYRRLSAAFDARGAG